MRTLDTLQNLFPPSEPEFHNILAHVLHRARILNWKKEAFAVYCIYLKVNQNYVRKSMSSFSLMNCWPMYVLFMISIPEATPQNLKRYTTKKPKNSIFKVCLKKWWSLEEGKKGENSKGKASMLQYVLLKTFWWNFTHSFINFLWE